MISAAQIRAARALVDLTQAQLASVAGVSAMTVKDIERGKANPLASTLDKIEKAFVRCGVLFLEPGVNRDGGPGVRMAKE